MYDPDLMPTNLRKAHEALDNLVDRQYLGVEAKSDRERVENLLNRYQTYL